MYLLIGEGAVVYHVADVVDEPGDGHGEPAVVVLRIQRVEVVLFWFQTDVARGVAVAGLGFVGGVKLRQGRRAEACRVGGTQVQSAELVHQRYVGSGIILEVLVVDVAYAQYGLQVQGQLYFILCVESEGVHVAGVDVVRFALQPLVYVFYAGRQFVAAAQAENTLDVSVVVSHLFAGHPVARQIVARLLEVHIVRRVIVRVELCIDVSRTVYHVLHAGAIGIGLVFQIVGIGVFLYELAFTFGIVGGVLRTAGFVIKISTARVER